MLNQNQTSDEDASLEDQRFNELVERIAREIPIEMEGIIGEWCQENLKTRTYYRDYLSLFSAEFLDQIERYVSALRASWFAYQVDEEDLFDAAIRNDCNQLAGQFGAAMNLTDESRIERDAMREMRR